MKGTILKPIGLGACIALALLVLAIPNISHAQDASRGDLTREVEASRLEGNLAQGPFREGAKLSRDEAGKIEARLAANPKDLPNRLRLMGHYESLHRQREADALEHFWRLALGIIEHHPRSVLAGDIGMMLVPRYLESSDSTAWKKGSQMWTALVDEHKDDPQILGNAGTYFVADLFKPKVRARGMELLERARTLDPANPRWAEELGGVYAEQMSMRHDFTETQRQEFAQKALENLEAFRASAKVDDPQPQVHGQHIFHVLAEAASIAGDWDKTKMYAGKLLEAIEAEEESWNYGNAIFTANELLGLAALRENRIEDAKKYLLAAGKTPGSPQLSSFGPSFALAQELLAKSEKETVLEFLDLVSNFWGAGRPVRPNDHLGARLATERQRLLDGWKAAIKNGEIPELDPRARPK